MVQETTSLLITELLLADSVVELVALAEYSFTCVEEASAAAVIVEVVSTAMIEGWSFTTGHDLAVTPAATKTVKRRE